MPRRKRRSQNALKRIEEKRNQIGKEAHNIHPHLDHDIDFVEAKKPCTSDVGIEILPPIVLSGSCHQGNEIFSSPGTQCTYISFYALVFMKIVHPNIWVSTDIDTCIKNGNEGYLKHCEELGIKPRMLMAQELPAKMCLFNEIFYCKQDDAQIRVGTLRSTISNELSSSLDDAVVQCFIHSNSCLFVCGGQTIAFTKHEERFYVFDPHARGRDALLHSSGNAVLISFGDISMLVSFIKKLFLTSLRVPASNQYELVPIDIANKIHGSCVEQRIDGDGHTERNLSFKSSDCICEQAKSSEVLMKDNLRLYFVDQKIKDHEHKLEDYEAKPYSSPVIKENKRTKYMREYMQKRRKDDNFRRKDNESTRDRLSNYRNTEIGRAKCNAIANKSKKAHLSTLQGRLKHNEKSRLWMKNMLSSEEARKKHNERSNAGMIKLLSSNEGRKRHNEQSLNTMKKSISTEEGRKKHNERSAEAMTKMLSSDKGRHKHNENSAKTMNQIRSSKKGKESNRKCSKISMAKRLCVEENRKKHNDQSLRGIRKKLTSEKNRKKHNERSLKGMKKMLSSEDGKNKHRESAVKSMKKILSTEEATEKHNLRSKETMRKITDTVSGKHKHNVRSVTGMKKIRLTVKGKSKNRETAAKGMKRLRLKREGLIDPIAFQQSINTFNSTVEGSASYVCTCCHQLWFRHSVRKLSSVKCLKSVDQVLLNESTTQHMSVGNSEWLCTTCFLSIKQGKIPRLAVKNGMSFPKKPAELNLTQLEERLISLRIPFMQIRSLNRGGQYSLKGSVVNVPADIEPTIRALPRLHNQWQTVPVKLKRLKEFKHAVISENIRPTAVVLALNFLLKTSDLYKEANISINEEWNANLPPNDSVHSDIESTDSEDNAFSETEESASVVTMLDDNDRNLNSYLSFAPGEGQRPLSMFKDPNAEYLAFPTLFCGQKRSDNINRNVPLYYSDICKWELRSVDRRVAQHIPNIFYKMKKLQIEQVCSKVNLAVRRCKTEGKNYTAGFILQDSMGESLVKLDEGYRIFRTIRNSPQYWENQKREVFAMIRQLGLPTLFISLSANDLNWPELIIALGKLVDRKDYTADIQTLSWETKSRLVQSDPVTCVRHFHHRVTSFIDIVLKNTNSPLGILKDYFYRVEFQQRGSPHIHMLTWIENSPKYRKESNEDIIEYINTVASCSSNVISENESYLEIQKHKHSRSCRKGGKPICRFGIPFPPMRQTMILQPYEGNEPKRYKEIYAKIQKLLNELGPEKTYDQFLSELRITEDDYLKALQTSITSDKVFLKRTPSENRINPYMKDMLGVWKANHDIQFVLDAYACAIYIVSYINKSAKGMSRLMSEACKEAKKGNKSLRDSVRHIGNKFLNATEISAQEAVYLILQLSLAMKSRKCEFISTAPKHERTYLLKSKKELEALPQDSIDIESDNIVKRYMRRDDSLQHLCLADYVAKVVSIKRILNENDINDAEEEIDEVLEHDQHVEENVSIRISNTQHYTEMHGPFKVTYRKNSKIIRYVHYNEKIDPENYYREQLMLFYPWKNESTDLLGEYETFKDHYKAVELQLLQKRTEYDQNSALLEQIEHATENEDLRDFVSMFPNIESVEATDSLTNPEISEAHAFYNPESREHAFHDLGMDINRQMHIPNQEVELVQKMLSEREYLNSLSNLNEKQRMIFTHVMHSLTTAPNEQLLLFLTGGAGVGKSLVIRVLYQALHRCLCSEPGQDPDNINILLCAYTGLAAYNINGCTLHNAFCIEPNKKLSYKPLSDDKKNTLRTKYRNLKVLIIDEVSMVGTDMLCFLFKRLQEIKGNHDPFGGIHLILVGDLYQLRPVGDGWIFNNNEQNYASLAPNLWRTFFKMFELTEIMRQKDDTSFAELLNRLREGNQTEEDLGILRSRAVFSHNSEYQDRIHIQHLFPCNKSVDDHNNLVYSLAETNKANIRCIDTVLGEDNQEIKSKIIEQLDGKKVNDTANLALSLHVAVGLSYDTTHNISVEDGICNGTPCVLKYIQYLEANKDVPSCLWVEFEEKDIGLRTRQKYRGYFRPGICKAWTPIWAIKRTFMFRRKAIIRQQFPLKASSAKTIHKAQGQTKSEIVVDLATGSRAHHHYVAFSRVTNLRGLFLLNGLNGQIKVDKNVLEEMKRLRSEALLELSYKPVSCSEQNMILTFQNAQSLLLHFPLIKNDATFYYSDVICLAETRLSVGDVDEDFYMKGFYPIIRNDQKPKELGRRPPHGLAAYVKKTSEVLSYHSLSNSIFEALILKVMHVSSTCYTILVVYKAPNCKFSDIKVQLISLEKVLPKENLIIVGDFNFDSSNSNNKQFIDLMKSLFPDAHLLPTNSTTKGNTTLDLAFTTCRNAKARIIVCTWSYHHTIVVSVPRS